MCGCAPKGEGSPDHVVIMSQTPMSWLQRQHVFRSNNNPGAMIAVYQVQDANDQPVVGTYWLLEHLTHGATHNNETVPEQLWFSEVKDIHDFYSPEQARKNGVANSSIHVDQTFTVLDAMGCRIDLPTKFRTTVTFEDGVQVGNHTIEISP